ncbi:MAG: hypothetical protein AVDCRST_MAG68-3087, partial [uncultured Gemmatimonadetes bacterium]
VRRRFAPQRRDHPQRPAPHG